MYKVYFVGNEYMGCWYVRCFLPMLHNGWSGSYLGLEKKLKPVKLVEQEMFASDVIVFHRANTNWHHRVGYILKQMGKKIVFDNDDTYKLNKAHPFWGLDEKGFKENKEKINNVINNFIINSDLVTCSTEYLAKEYKKINHKVVVLPNYVDPDDWPEPLRNEDERVRIGLVGSVAYNHDFEHIQDVIRKLNDNPKVQLVLFGIWKGKQREENPLVDKVLKKEYAFWDSLNNLEHFPWCSMVDYFDTLNSMKLDMMLIPRRENDFNKSKSNVKYLEASMLEIPVIAQSFRDGKSPYDKDLDGLNGILIRDNKDWYEAIMDLVENKEKRRLMGATAKQYVLNNYNIKDHAYKWQEAYNKLFI